MLDIDKSGIFIQRKMHRRNCQKRPWSLIIDAVDHGGENFSKLMLAKVWEKGEGFERGQKCESRQGCNGCGRINITVMLHVHLTD
jgi:hypothetical protein